MGSDLAVTSVEANDLHVEVLPPETQRAFAACIDLHFLQPHWYLAGGTALALQVGHRSSEYLDFFTQQKDFDAAALEDALMRHGIWETTLTREGTLWGLFEGAKMSFISYPFFNPSHAHLECGTVRILTIDDIAAMKILAVSQRCKKRDFIDMYWYCAVHGGSLEETMSRAVAQFPDRNHNIPHLLKSFVYFEDAESDPMPQLHFKADWDEIKAYFRREVPKIANKLLGLNGASA